MKLKFRQGIARHQTDVNGNPIFLQRSGGSGQFIDLIVSPTPTVLVFAHRTGTYLIEELKTVPNAWGPITSGTTYLYWDINLLSGALTRGVTLLAPLYTSGAPTTPAVDQHWFDTVENVFRVWNGSKWVEKIRLFAGHVTSGAIIHASKTGSQAGLNGDFEGGNIVLDSFGMALRQSNGCFVTTTTWLNVVNLGTITARLDAAIMSGMAAEELPKFSAVGLRPGKQLVLARSTDYTSRVAGVVVEDLYEGEVGRVLSTGVLRNENWAWPDSSVNQALFCGPTGQITTVPPTNGVLQQIGFVYDSDSIFVDLKQPVVLDDPTNIPDPVIPVPGIPTADFTMSATSGVAPFSVTFTNTSLNATDLEWDFVNDGFVDSTALNPTYTFSTPGVYTVRLRAINANGFDDEIKMHAITVAEPNVGPLNVNLGLSFGAPSQVQAGQAFSFQVIVSNDGSANATNVSRDIVLRSSNGSEVLLINPPVGSVVQRAGPLTKLQLPLVNINSGSHTAITLQAQAQTNVSAIQIEGKVQCAQTDPEQDDNRATLTIGVRP